MDLHWPGVVTDKIHYIEMNTETHHSAKFVNTISKPDLYSCLALWMEEYPLASTVVCDFESLELSGLGRVENSINIYNEHSCSPENGPLRKKSKRDDCSIEDKVKLGEFNRSCDTNSISGNHSGFHGSKGQEKYVCCGETVSNCAEADCVDVEEKSSKGCSFRVNKIGVVMVDTSENIVAINCSRDNVHGVTSVLIDFSDRARNCVIYASRKPCSFCTKLMIQAGVSRVCYLPFEAENPDEVDLKKAEKLIRMSEIGQSIHVPNIQTALLTDSELKSSPYAPNKLSHTNFLLSLLSRYWNEQWKSRIVQVLNWPEYNGCKQQVDLAVSIMLEWLARVTYGDLPDSVNFSKCGESDPEIDNVSIGCSATNCVDAPLIPDPVNLRWQELARHLSRMANILAQCSNDPKRGVGAVILQHNQIVSACWNGYPPKSGYGDFPRASHSDGPLFEKKYAFSIHAEQAAILGRNTRDISDASSTMYVSKTPCDECVPLILKAGIKNVVFPRDTRKRDPAFLRYSLIQRTTANGRLNGFESSFLQSTQSGSDSASQSKYCASRLLCFNGLGCDSLT